MNRLLYNATNKIYDSPITEIDGGGLRNAIPRESTAVLVVLKSQVEAFLAEIHALAITIQNELQAREPDLIIEVSPTTAPRHDYGPWRTRAFT